MSTQCEELAAYKIINDDGFEVQFEILPPVGFDPQQKVIDEAVAACDDKIRSLEEKVAELNVEIDRLTNHADGIDYATAVVCGLIAGVIDSIYVGAWDFKDAKAKANKEINQQIEDFAKKCGYVDKGQGLAGAVKFLEKKFPMPGDGSYNGLPGADFVTHSTHHLDDFCHHPTIVGLICNIIRQFTQTAKYHDKNGTVIIAENIAVNTYEGTFEAGDNPVAKCFCGIVNWFIVCAKSMANAKGHWMSDMAGSSQAVQGGTNGAGLPGSFMSLLKELSSLPIFNSTDKNGNPKNAFAEGLRKAFQNGIGDKKSQLNLGPFNCLFEGSSSKFDARTELAVKNLLKKQAVPVLVNEALVRGSYFIRRLVRELKAKDSLADIEWRNVLPFNNRTIARMLTIATGTFTACDLADATIRSGVSNGFNVYNPKFWSDIILRVNFVGVGRFAVAVVTDVGMGIKRNIRVGELIGVNTELQLWKDAKILYKQGEIWIAAKQTDEAICECFVVLQNSCDETVRTYRENAESLKSIGESADRLSKSAAGAELVSDMLSQLKYLN